MIWPKQLQMVILRQTLDVKSQDEFGQMAKHLNRMKDNLVDIIQQVSLSVTACCSNI